MKPLALELNDRALSIARDGRVLSTAPSAIFDGTGSEPAGANAWQALRRQPTSISTRHLGSVAGEGGHAARSLALLNAELAQRIATHQPAAGERVWIAAPARINASGLGDVLGIARSLGLSVDGFVDSAAVTAAALRPERNALVLELGLHHLAVTAVDSNGQTRRRRAVISERAGLIELYDAWLDLISAAMVKRTRFDPLHDAASEQQLFDALPSLTLEAATAGSATAHVTVGSEKFDVSLSRDQFAAAAQPIYREILRLLHALRPAGAAVALIMPQVIANAPGLRELLQSFVGCELIALPDGFAAAATSLLDLPQSADEQAVRLLRRLPSSQQPELVALATRELLGSQRSDGPTASHVLFEGKAYALSDVLTIGRAPDSPDSIQLPEGLAGVSRRHCTLVRDGGELVLVDHSSFGTVVNGERVSERVRLHAGDRIRIGDPGVEFSLLSLNA
jgi:hypothetical protein